MTGLEAEDLEQKPRRRKKKGRNSQLPKDGAVAAQDATSCSVCGHAFASRNQMFKHIASTGHAVRR